MRLLRSAAAVVPGLVLALLAPPAQAVPGDTTGPVITFGLPSGQVDGWWALSNMSIGVQVVDESGATGFSWTRSTGGSGTVTGIPGSVSVNVQGLTTVTVTAADGEGNVSTESVTVGLDFTLPSVRVTGRLDPDKSDRVYALNETVTVSYSCSDPEPGSGLASCEAAVPPGGSLDTDTVGTNQQFSVTATDKVGRTLTRIVTYAVVEPEMAVTTPIELSGSGLVGDELSGTAATFDPWPTSVSYTWHRDGEEIPGATGRTYTPTAADVGHDVTLVATAKRSAFNDAQAVSDPITVAPGELTMSDTPQLLGEPRVGEELTVDHGPAFPWGEVYTYRWIRDLDEEIATTEEPSYVLTPEDAGHHISVLVQVETPGYLDGGWFSLPVGPVADAGPQQPPPPPPATDLPLVASGAPAVAGTPTVGSTITATLPSFTPDPAAPGETVSTVVEWLRDGQPIAGAAGTTYRLGAADVGHAVSVRVTGSAPRHRAQTVTSPATAVVGKAASALRLTAKPARKGLRVTVSATAPGLAPTGTVAVTVRGKVVARLALVDGAATTTLRKLRPGRVVLTASYAGDGSVAASTTSKKVKVKRATRR